MPAPLSPARAAEAAEYVRAHWRYKPATGVVTGRCGKPIGTLRKDGALQVLVYLLSGTTSVLLHRAAWLLKTGVWPDFEVDHKDGDRANNRWKNIRAATHGQNRQNLKKVTAAGNLRGTTRYYNKWKAQIKTENKHHYLGLFATEAEAHAAYCTAKAKLHEFNPEQRT